MQIELTPEIEKFLQAESSATGLAPAEVAERLLRECALGGLKIVPEKVDEATQETQVSPELKENRRLAVEAWIARRAEPDAPTLNLPEGMSIRQWLLEDYRYKD